MLALRGVAARAPAPLRRADPALDLRRRPAAGTGASATWRGSPNRSESLRAPWPPARAGLSRHHPRVPGPSPNSPLGPEAREQGFLLEDRLPERRPGRAAADGLPRGSAASRLLAARSGSVVVGAASRPARRRHRRLVARRRRRTACPPGPGRHNRLRPAAPARPSRRARRATGPRRRAFLLCRSGGPGMQRFGAACWSGDINTTFAALEAQIRRGPQRRPLGRALLGHGHRRLLRRRARRRASSSPAGSSSAPSARCSGRTAAPGACTCPGPTARRSRRYAGVPRAALPPDALHLHARLAGAQDGLPLMRPLVLNYPDDPRVWDLGSAVSLGRRPAGRTGDARRVRRHWPVYLPARAPGTTSGPHETYRGPRGVDRAGAVGPAAALRARRRHPAAWAASCNTPDGQAPRDLTRARLPGRAGHAFTLYEDDGETSAIAAAASR